MDYRGVSGIRGISAPIVNSSCSRPASNVPCPHHQSPRGPPSPVAGPSGAFNNNTPAHPDCSGLENLCDIFGSGLSSLGPPNFYESFSSAGTLDLDCSRRSGLSGVVMPSLNSTLLSDLNASSPNQSFTSTPCRNEGSRNPTMEFSPYRTPPNLMQFSSDSSGQGSGEITRYAELPLFGDSSFSRGSCDRGIGIRRLTPLNQSPQVPRTEDSMMEQMVNDAWQFFQNMSNAGSYSSSLCPSGRRALGAASTVPGTPLALPQIGSTFLWSPYNTTIGNSTLEDLRWGSFEENLNSSNTSGGSVAYDMEWAVQLPFANNSLNSTGSYEKTSNLKGFHLTYEAFVGGTSYMSSESEDYFLSDTQGSQSHPSVGAYSNNEISTFIFTSEDNLFNSKRLTEITAYAANLESGCYDYLEIFSYNPFVLGQNASWTVMDTICSSTFPVSWTARELQMVVFRSDKNNVYTGLRLDFEKFIS